MNPLPAFFDHAEPDPIGLILGTGYNRFSTPFGIDGLAKWTHDRLDVLAVGASHPGSGAFRTFIEQAKKHFRQVFIWHIINPLLNTKLAEYGFVRAKQTEPDGEKIEGWKWEAHLRSAASEQTEPTAHGHESK
jgi:hypothetical protein